MSPVDQLFSANGFKVLVAVIFVILLFVSLTDLVSTWLRKPTIGQHVNAAVTGRWWVAVLVMTVFGAMIAHFFVYITHA